MGIFDKLYQKQKELLRKVQDNVEDVGNDIYEEQKAIIRDAQVEVVNKMKEDVKGYANVLFDKMVAGLEKKSFWAKLVAMVLKRYKDDILKEL